MRGKSKMDLDYLLSMMEGKDTSKGFEALKELETISESTNALYLYMDKFIDMVKSEKYVIRVCGFRLFCKQARWDVDNVINQNIEEVLSILNDEKPTAVRQALSALKEVVLYKSELVDIIKERVLAIDYYKHKETMHSLIAKDIGELVEIMNKMKYVEEFKVWVEKYLIDLPEDAVAINFNLYEGEEAYSVQLIAADEFDEEDEDWACEEIFSTEDDLFVIPMTEDIKDWEEALFYIKSLIEEYLNVSSYKSILKKLQGIGVGFVDGNVELLTPDD